jgi:outer membrane receptor protein involved in Fe transport
MRKNRVAFALAAAFPLVFVVSSSAQYAVSKDTDLTFSVVNLLDKVYSENAYTYGQTYSQTLSSPRTLNVGVKVRF